MLRYLLEKSMDKQITDKQFNDALVTATDYIKNHKKIITMKAVLIVLEASIKINKIC